MPRDPLFPSVEAYRTGTLAVDPVHTLYFEESGNPDGVPVVFLHGGPGAGASPLHRRFFDPNHYRIVIFDQRGAGRSRPLGEVADNTPDDLVSDIERLRQHLDINRWHVFGGSWGSTLGLLYAQSHPQRCISLVLRGIFLMRQHELDWFLYGIRNFFPEAWQRFSGFLPESERSDLMEGYHKRLMDPDPAIHMPAARSWSAYEASCSTLMPNPHHVSSGGSDSHALSIARLEAHFMRDAKLQPETRILDNVDCMRSIPGAIVQGRYDVICPPASAMDLHKAWPEAQFTMVPDAGHSPVEPGTRKALIEATQKFRRLT
ncbi:MAG: prolyl aminopeptidase [Pseudomonadota bacterium]